MYGRPMLFPVFSVESSGETNVLVFTDGVAIAVEMCVASLGLELLLVLLLFETSAYTLTESKDRTYG
jgi:hypothetical protein